MPAPSNELMRFLTLPHLLSLSRIALAPAIACAILGDAGTISIGLFCLAVLTDVLDGRIARGRQQTSRLGTSLDHGADAIFVTAVCAVFAYLGLLPPFLPPLIAIAFIQYLLDSRVLDGANLRPSALGRWNGIAYFVIAGCAILAHHYAADPVAVSVVRALGWILVATTLLSIAERALHLLRVRPIN
jgi:phosphatidylglycerophosphate synthase